MAEDYLVKSRIENLEMELLKCKDSNLYSYENFQKNMLERGIEFGESNFDGAYYLRFKNQDFYLDQIIKDGNWRAFVEPIIINDSKTRINDFITQSAIDGSIRFPEINEQPSETDPQELHDIFSYNHRESPVNIFKHKNGDEFCKFTNPLNENENFAIPIEKFGNPYNFENINKRFFDEYATLKTLLADKKFPELNITLEKLRGSSEVRVSESEIRNTKFIIRENSKLYNEFKGESKIEEKVHSISENSNEDFQKNSGEKIRELEKTIRDAQQQLQKLKASSPEQRNPIHQNQEFEKTKKPLTDNLNKKSIEPNFETPFTIYLSKDAWKTMALIHRELELTQANHVLYHGGKHCYIDYNRDAKYREIVQEEEKLEEKYKQARRLYGEAKTKGVSEKEISELYQNIKDTEKILGKCSKERQGQTQYLRINGFSDYTRGQINDQLKRMLNENELKAYFQSRVMNKDRKDSPLSESEHKELHLAIQKSLTNALSNTKSVILDMHKENKDQSTKTFGDVKSQMKGDQIYYERMIIKNLNNPNLLPDERRLIISGLKPGGHILNAANQIKNTLVQHPIFKRLVHQVSQRSTQQEQNNDHGR